jgi:hypothetical protein
MVNCFYNDHLMCNAKEVHVGPGADNAACLIPVAVIL